VRVTKEVSERYAKIKKEHPEMSESKVMKQAREKPVRKDYSLLPDYLDAVEKYKQEQTALEQDHAIPQTETNT
jgi:serine protease inhibitor